MRCDISTFGQSYRRFLIAADWLHRMAPARLRFSVAARLGHLLSPFRPRRDQIEAALQSALQLSPPLAEAATMHWLASHGLFAMTLFRYGRLTRSWLADEVVVDDPAALAQVAARGGMVLTYHSHHHNTLGCVLGLSGCHITGLAASAAGSPLYAYIGRYIDRINEGSAAHFGGGGYLFTDEPVTLLRETRRLLRRGDVIVNLCDFHVGGGGPVGTLFGKSIEPPAGAIDVSLAVGAPIYAAILFPDQGRFRLCIRRLDCAQGTVAVLAQYFGYLEDIARAHPHCWQGWEWYGNLPDGV